MSLYRAIYKKKFFLSSFSLSATKPREEDILNLLIITLIVPGHAS